jgi:acyl-CoA hydrolase
VAVHAGPSPQRLDPARLASVLPARGHTFVSSASAESALLLDEVKLAGDALGDMSFSGIFVPGLNRRPWIAGAASRVVTFFQTPELQKIRERVRFLPLCYQDISRWYAANPPDAVMLMVSPPDEQGQCSFGVELGFGGDLWRTARTRIAHINPAMPRTRGDPGIPFSEITAFYEAEQPLLTMPGVLPDPVTDAIAANVAAHIPDGATLQTGLGKLPDAVLDRLHSRRSLRFFTGLAGDAALRLIQSDAMAEGPSALVGCAIGSESLYSGLGNNHLQFSPVSVTHDLSKLMEIKGLIAINSVMSIDLFGQGFAESTIKGFVSGPGGANDFARGARASQGGLRIVALPSNAKGESRIAVPGETIGPVSLSRFDIDIVATEYGSADLRNCDYHERARALIAIAHPDHRDALAAGWARLAQEI